MQENKTVKWLWIGLAVGALIVVVLVLLSSVLDVGARLKELHPVVSYVFYALSVVLFYFLVLRPIFQICFSPSFNVNTTLDQGNHNNGVYIKVAKRLMKQYNLEESDKKMLLESLHDSLQLKATLSHIFNHQIKNEINKKIRSHAKSAFITTAISQNARLDSISMFLISVRLVRDIVYMCGYRPSWTRLAKLTVRIFMTALIAEGLENMDISSLLPNNLNRMIGEIPLLKPILSSALDGSANALMVIRIGVVTRKYLYSDAGEISDTLIKREAFLETAKIFPLVLADALLVFPRSIINLFNPKPPKDDKLSLE